MGHAALPGLVTLSVRPREYRWLSWLRAHLEALQRRFDDRLGDCEVKEFAGTDYAYRIFIDKPTWASVVVALVSEMDYDNFKGEVGRHTNDAAYRDALHDVWDAMHELQKNCP